MQIVYGLLCAANGCPVSVEVFEDTTDPMTLAGQIDKLKGRFGLSRVVLVGDRRPAKRPVVAHIDPTSPGVGLALGQDRHNGVVAVQPLGAEDVLLDGRISGASTAQQPPT